MQKDDIFIEYDLPQPLTKEQIYDYLKQYHNGNISARNKLIEYNIRLVKYLVGQKFFNTPYEQKELFSIGIMGLIKAIDTFDINRNLEFSTYASRCIINEILMYIRKYKKELQNESLEKVFIIDDKNESKLKDILFDEKTDIIGNYENKEVIISIRNIVENLPERDKTIVKLYFGFYDDIQHTQTEIAQQFGLSQSQVSRLLLKIVKNIKNELQKEGIIEKTSNKIKIR